MCAAPLSSRLCFLERTPACVPLHDSQSSPGMQAITTTHPGFTLHSSSSFTLQDRVDAIVCLQDTGNTKIHHVLARKTDKRSLSGREDLLSKIRSSSVVLEGTSAS